jgi:hypothetical protein
VVSGLRFTSYTAVPLGSSLEREREGGSERERKRERERERERECESERGAGPVRGGGVK